MSAAGEPTGIVADFLALQALARKPVVGAADLAANLRRIYKTVFEVDLDRYDLRQVRRIAPSLMQAIFEMRLELRRQIGDWQQRKLISSDVERALRDVFRISRYGVDMLGELANGFARSEADRRAFTGPSSRTFINPRFYDGSHIPFRSGDVLLVRGTAHNSAAIARIGDVDSQFSHVGVVFRDEADQPWIVEALIEAGSVITPLESFVNEGLARAVLYRHRSADLAQRAAASIERRVRKSRGRWQRRIQYDFSFGLDSYDSLFCSKLVRQAYDGASEGKYLLPTFKTRLDMKNRDFFDRIGVRAAETFAPADIDLEPDFDLVAEWQDYSQTSMLRLQDLMMDKVFQWMEEHGWTFQETPLIAAISTVGRAASFLSEDAKDLMESTFHRVPANMSRRAIAVIAMLHQTGEEIMKSLSALEDDTIRMLGRPAHPREISAHLESLRERADGEIGYLVAPR
ncbi:MAG: YiiX/YebB-like N1pC/P60 family cysteine hydrolase [Hyphomicrobium sp.]